MLLVAIWCVVFGSLRSLLWCVCVWFGFHGIGRLGSDFVCVLMCGGCVIGGLSVSCMIDRLNDLMFDGCVNDVCLVWVSRLRVYMCDLMLVCGMCGMLGWVILCDVSCCIFGSVC